MKANWSCRKPLLIFVFFFAFISLAVTAAENELVVVTVATHTTDGFLRFNRSINQYGLKLEVLGLEEEWKGGDIARRPGGGQKILLLKKYLKSIIDEKKRIVLFTDSYDVIFTGGASEILKKFYSFDSNVVFSSEKYCWPNPSLATEYPKTDGKRYLNSGGFIGFASNLYTIVSHSSVDNEDDDQLYYTKIYLNAQLRNEINIKLDLTSYLFQNLNGAISDVEIRFVQSNGIDETIPDALLVNKVFQTQPVVVHGNGASKTVLNSLGNYLAKSWHPATGCLWCNEGRIDLNQLSSNDYPYVLVAVNILKPTPFLTEFFEDLTLLDYPKEKITVYIQSLVDYHLTETNAFVDDYKSFYKSVKYTERSEEWRLRNSYLDECVRLGCDYLLVLDTEARIINHQTLQELIEANKKIIAPMLVRPNEYWSNFWGALTHDGFYSRSHDYVQIIKNERSGIWNVPYIAQAYLLNASLLNEQNHLQSFKALSYGTGKDDEFDPDMYMCKLLRENGVFLYLTNLNEYGHLARLDTFDISRKHPDFYEIYSNEIEWRRRYIHENYSQVLQEDYSLEQPCPDVYWFPVTSPVFCQHLIEIMENFGSWSAGRNQDPRLSGGYENVPTVDIHMNQVGLEQHWLYFLRQYIRPVQEKVFIGYHHDPPKAIMNFVVRYHPKEQSFLRAHHDSSTYTINIALNRPKIDYEGGGCRFIRYNCSLTNLRLGWSLIHPGRLTHYHEGLTVTKGVRYIMVSFVDP